MNVTGRDEGESPVSPSLGRPVGAALDLAPRIAEGPERVRPIWDK